ncbi:MAG: hypothetical protein IK002_06200 [Treponema sp.]|uniref:hypothetical protein n=1 Tax=Treponema sp. TaxID=166 RepID=UPI00298DD9F6|nr:hypothetical protein [Treponema sp.]MBR5933564.1 hypothetical protein [Treponema sp.]
MNKDNNYSDFDLASSLPQEQREAILRALEFERNPSEQNARYVCEVMDTLFKIKNEMKKKDDIQKRIDEVIKFAIRKNSDNPTVKQFFRVAPPFHKYKIDNPEEMFARLLKLFENPLDFSSCIEINYKKLKELMGDAFINQNSDIISDSEYMPAVFFSKKD